MFHSFLRMHYRLMFYPAKYLLSTNFCPVFYFNCHLFQYTTKSFPCTQNANTLSPPTHLIPTNPRFPKTANPSPKTRYNSGAACQDIRPPSKYQNRPGIENIPFHHKLTGQITPYPGQHPQMLRHIYKHGQDNRSRHQRKRPHTAPEYFRHHHDKSRGNHKHCNLFRKMPGSAIKLPQIYFGYFPPIPKCDSIRLISTKHGSNAEQSPFRENTLDFPLIVQYKIIMPLQTSPHFTWRCQQMLPVRHKRQNIFRTIGAAALLTF